MGLLLFAAGPTFAEFQIQEAGIEKGEVELEYRGAYHWGVPQVIDTNENANDLVQSHEFELQMGITDWWLLSVTAGLDQPLDGSLQGNAVEIETEFALLKRQGDGIALSFQTGYEQAFNHGAQVGGDANQFGFGPIVELAKGPFLLTLNPLFTKQIGTFADQEGLGFQYGWRGEYDFSKRWGVGVEMFGEIEDLANADRRWAESGAWAGAERPKTGLGSSATTARVDCLPHIERHPHPTASANTSRVRDSAAYAANRSIASVGISICGMAALT